VKEPPKFTVPLAICLFILTAVSLACNASAPVPPTPVAGDPDDLQDALSADTVDDRPQVLATLGRPDAFDISIVLVEGVKVRMAGSAAQGDEAAQDETAAPEPAATEPSPAEGATPPPPDVDTCTLLPVDENAVDMRSDVHCLASIDALLGCDACGSRISITRIESAERAQQLARETYCGNPNFVACGVSPIGDAGITSTDISDEVYRPEVAFSYFRVTFSYGRYLVSIDAEIPGKQELVIGIGQEVIERIDASRSD
jgi:hypothetical protein